MLCISKYYRSVCVLLLIDCRRSLAGYRLSQTAGVKTTTLRASLVFRRNSNIDCCSYIFQMMPCLNSEVYTFLVLIV